MPDHDFTIRYYPMTIEGLEGEQFVVAKLRRVSSSPVQVGTVTDSMGGALGRLVDIIRLKESRNYADLKAVEWALAPDYMESAEAEWAEYEKVICRLLGVERLEPFRLTRPSSVGSQLPTLAVAFHEATMNDRPYTVARVGAAIMGSPAPVYLTSPRHRQSALERLRDVFRIGVRGQAWRDFMEAGRRLGKREVEIIREWQEYGQAMAW